MKINTETEYERAAACLETLTHARPGTKAAKELKILVLAMVDYLRAQRGKSKAA